MEKTCTLLNPMEDQSELFNTLLKLRLKEEKILTGTLIF